MANVFYSWQSESPGKTNRNLIEKALEASLKAIAQDATIEVSPRLDKDTQDVPGAPDIAATIFEKIDRAAVFVCDVSLVARGEGVRPTPNPNVLVELGYALAKLGWSRIVMVLNEATGPVEELPFDLNKKRTLVYRSEEDDEQRAPARDDLRKRLDGALRVIFENYRAPVVAAAPSSAEHAIKAIEADSRDVVSRVTAYMKDLAASLDGMKPPAGKGQGDDDNLMVALEASEPAAAEYGTVVEAIARFGHTAAAKAVFRGFERIHEGYEHPETGGSWYDTDFDFHRFIGHELFVMFVAALVQHERWECIAEVLDERLCVRTRSGSETWAFQCLSVFVKLLDIRNERLQLRKPVLHGEVLKERHEREPLASVSPFDAFVDAEFFLFLRAELAPAKSPLSEQGDAPSWRPWTALFMNWKVPTYLVRAERKNDAERLLKALAVPDVATFRQRYASRAANIIQFFRSRTGFFQLGKLDVEKFGSK